MLYDEGSPAVIIDNATKSFNSHLVLDSFNMSIQQGSIYALIGPSGCGKTTVLGCIVGICGMDSGSIRLSIKRKCQLGYMPQDCGLNNELSLEEIFYFHGRINFMTEQDIKSRIQQLVRLLDLPDVTQIVTNISGGQYRRVSLAVALLHDPKLLLLDEPTVGLDPVLRHDIWDHLKQLATKQKKTILLTTHYIEEAKFADTVGFMMEGTILEEGSPYHLIQTYRMNYLEEIFLYLAKQHRNRITSELCSEYTKERKIKQLICSPLIYSSTFSKARLKAQILKNFSLIKKSFIIILYLGLLAPTLITALLYETIGRNPFGLNVGAVNAAGLNKCDDQHIRGCDALLPCRLVENLRSKSYNVIEYSNERFALDAVKTNKVWGVVNFPPNFTASLLKLYSQIPNVDDFLIFNSTFNISMDMSNSIIGSQVQKQIKDSYDQVLTELFVDCGWSVRSLNAPIKFNKPVFGENKVQFRRYIFPGIMSMFPFVFACILSTASILMDKTTKVFERSIVSGLLWSEFLIAHIVIVLILLIFNVAAPYFVVFGLYKEIHHGHYLTSYTITYFQGVCGMCCGILIAVVCKMETLATQILVTIIFFCTYGSGGMWPVEGMHWFARYLSLCLPATLPLEAIRNVIDRGWSLTNFAVLKGIVSSLFWSLFFITIASYVMCKKTKIKSN